MSDPVHLIVSFLTMRSLVVMVKNFALVLAGTIEAQSTLAPVLKRRQPHTVSFWCYPIPPVLSDMLHFTLLILPPLLPIGDHQGFAPASLDSSHLDLPNTHKMKR